jgi:hypothetical protein
VKTPVGERLRAEAVRFSFRFACDDCAHFDEQAARCSLSYPAAPRQGALALDVVELCKEFELGA